MNRFNIFLFSVFVLLSCKDPVTPPDIEPVTIDTTKSVRVWLTTGNEAYKLEQRNSLEFSREFGDFTIQIDTTTTYQRMDGFGAALTGSSAFLLKNLPAHQRDSILRDLFDPQKGIGINYLRLTIGSSDFNIGIYSYADGGTIESFAIPERDRIDLLPVLKEILAINPTIKILASPWSAPAWMKKNNSMLGGSLRGPEVYADFAEYFVRYVKAFAAEGITIDAITLQNEPMHQTNGYPTMLMEWTEQNEIIRDYLGPAFKANNLSTKIIIWDHNFDMSYYPMNILNDPVTRTFVDGTGWHGYGGNASAIDRVQEAHPDKNVYFTEQSGGGWNTDTPMGNMFYYMREFLMASVNRGSKNFIMWNLALNPDHGPTTTSGGCQNCRGVITIRPDGSYLRNEEYFLIGHFSKFVRLNAVRVENSTTNPVGGVTVSSFMNTDGSKVVVVMNRSGNKLKYAVRCGDRKFAYEQYNESVVTFRF
jgi:glucosylceramidase